jgi:hypothetical protein
MKIKLPAAIAFLNTAYVGGSLNVFALEFRKTNGDYVVKQSVCKVNIEEANEQMARITDKASPKVAKMKGLYSVVENRIVRLFDMEKNHNFSVKIDLLCKINGTIIDHEP